MTEPSLIDAAIFKMKVFRIKTDVNNYQWLIPNVPDSQTLDYVFDCRSRQGAWRPPKIYPFSPTDRRGDFFKFGTGTLVASASAGEAVRTFFQMAGEQLPIFLDGERLVVLNVLTCVNALNAARIERAPDGWITRFSFHEDKLSGSSIFKVPETRAVDVLTWERDGNPALEFKAFVESTRVTGLIFEELWDSENE